MCGVKLNDEKNYTFSFQSNFMKHIFLYAFFMVLSSFAFAQAEEEPIADFAEEEPTYKGGYEAMFKFIEQNFVYPDSSRINGEQGTVFVQFVVNTDGTLTEIEVLRGVSPLLDAEAKRVVSIMPPWNPGSNGGKYVRVRYRIPIKCVI